MKTYRKLLCAVVVAFLCIVAGAQNVSCHFGVIGNLGINEFKDFKNLNNASQLGGGAGISLLLKVPCYFSIQPTVKYEFTKFRVPQAEYGSAIVEQQVVSVPVPIQWGPDLGILRPFVEVVPFANFNLDGKWRREEVKGGWANARNFLSTTQLGVGLGGGIELWKLQISARYNWLFGDWQQIKASGNPFNNISGKRSGITVSVAFFFN